MKRLLAVVLGLFFVLPISPGFSEWFDGDVGKVDLENKTVTVSEVDPITDTEESSEIVISDATTFSGIKSLAELKAGDAVSVEAKYDEPTDSWRALSVELPEAGE